jgi:hypothetical protein
MGLGVNYGVYINFFLLGLSSVLSLMFTLINLVVPPAVRPPLVRLLLPLSQCTASSGDRITPTPPFAPWVGCFSGPWQMKSWFSGRILWKFPSRCVSVRMKASMDFFFHQSCNEF